MIQEQILEPVDDQRSYAAKCEDVFSAETNNLQNLLGDVVQKLQDNYAMQIKYSAEIEECEKITQKAAEVMEEKKKKKLEQLEQLLQWD